MAIDGIGSSTNNVEVVDASQAGFAGLTSESFMKLLITQLQNQDPTEPVGNEELLNQISAMRNLQSNIELGDALKAVTSNQQIATAASFIGKSITGTSTTNQSVTGVVDRAFLSDGQATVGVGDQIIAIDQITTVNQASAA